MDVYLSDVFVYYPLRSDSILRMRGMRIATSRRALLAMTVVIDSLSANFAASSYQIPVSLRTSAHTGVAIRFPLSEALH